MPASFEAKKGRSTVEHDRVRTSLAGVARLRQGTLPCGVHLEDFANSWNLKAGRSVFFAAPEAMELEILVGRTTSPAAFGRHSRLTTPSVAGELKSVSLVQMTPWVQSLLPILDLKTIFVPEDVMPLVGGADPKSWPGPS